jgi:hypothetical protein
MTSSTKSVSAIFIRPGIYVLVLLLIISSGIGCYKHEFPWSKQLQKSHPPDVAVAWMNLQLRLTRGTPGFNSIVANRSYAYVGLTLYESIAPGIPGYKSIASQLNGSLKLPSKNTASEYYWPASANAALAFITKNLFANSSPALISAIDSLEADFTNKFQANSNDEALQNAIDFGREIAMAIFEWSKIDGGHEAYKNITSASYSPPTGTGLWIPTFPAFSQPFHPFWGNNRSFIPNLVAKTSVPPPPEYSESPESDFYKAANYVYMSSQNLSSEDSLVARFWADLPANYNVPAHAANIVTQLVLSKKLSLPEAAVLYCKHGMAGNEALITCFATKYKYNVIRPITYIRNVLGHINWTSVIPTPPFPEYTSAHAVVSSAFAAILEEKFGENFSFTDRSYDNLYGTRTFESFQEYVNEAAQSRVYGGIHYQFAATEGIKQGRKVGEAVNSLKFK